MEHLENIALDLIKASISYTEKKGSPLTEEVKRHLLECEPFRKILAFVLSESTTLTEENIKRYRQTVQALNERIPEMRDLPEIPEGVFSSALQKRVVFQHIIRFLYIVFSMVGSLIRILEHPIDEKILELSAERRKLLLNAGIIDEISDPKFGLVLLLPLKYPDAFQKIHVCIVSKIIPLLPASLEENIQNIVKEKGVTAGLKEVEQLMPQLQVSGKDIQSIHFLNRLAENISQNEKIIKLADSNLSEVPEVFSEKRLDAFLQSTQQCIRLRSMHPDPETRIQKTIQDNIEKYIAFAEQQLEPSVESLAGCFFKLCERDLEGKEDSVHNTLRP